MKTGILTMALWAFYSLGAMAQADKEDVRIALALLNKNKKALIDQAIPVDSLHKDAFWKLYNEYEDKNNNLLTERIGIIQQYVLAYDTLQEPKAIQLAEGIQKNTQQIDELHREYFTKFRKIVGGIDAARLYQIELYVQTAIQYKAEKDLPLIGELNKN